MGVKKDIKMNPQPIEKNDPEFSKLLNWFCNKLNKNRIYKKKPINDNTPIIKTNKKIKRNDPCFCGSGKKFKKCCYK